MNEKKSTVDCSAALEVLDARWTGSPLSTAAANASAADDLAAHLERCPDCRSAAEDLERMDACLRTGFRELESLVGSPTREQIEETIRRVSGESPDAELIRKVRRPLRMILWGAFFAFTLLAVFVLARAIYEAYHALMSP
jgi:hypothetical protein